MSLWQTLFGNSQTGTSTKTREQEHKAKPTVEPLEDRVLLSVFGVDDRTKVTNTTDYPWRAIGKISITFKDGASFIGTAALVDPNHALTAGHCVYDPAHGGWASSIKFTPGQNGSSKPYGSAYMTYMRSYTSWTNSQDSNYDMALITLDRRIGDTVGWFGYEAQSDSFFNGGNVNTAGYPGDKGGDTLWKAYGPVHHSSSLKFYYNGTLDTYGGQSGSPVWRYDSSTGNRYIVGIHTNGGSTYNAATRLTSARINDMKRWIQEDQASTRRTELTESASDTNFLAGPNDTPDATNALREPFDVQGATPQQNQGNGQHPVNLPGRGNQKGHGVKKYRGGRKHRARRLIAHRQASLAHGMMAEQAVAADVNSPAPDMSGAEAA